MFSIAADGFEKVIYSFKGNNNGAVDGKYPIGPLIYVNGLLYGTTLRGGRNAAIDGGSGTVFSVTLSGVETILHAFSDSLIDGSVPISGLTFVGGVLYGTTAYGGKYGQGTVFKVGTGKVTK